MGSKSLDSHVFMEVDDKKTNNSLSFKMSNCLNDDWAFEYLFGTYLKFSWDEGLYCSSSTFHVSKTLFKKNIKFLYVEYLIY